MLAQFRYPGIEGVLSASVTIGLGITPSVTSVSIPPRELPRRGDIVWRYGGSVVRTFKNCALDSAEVSRSGGFTTLQVRILDRRWTWTTGQISGIYNVRKKGEVVEESEKTPRELAELCLEAMNEQSFDVDALPEDDRPYIEWDLTNPAKALSDLCDMYGCAVSLQIDDSVKIVKLGEGEEFPAGFLSNDFSIDPANVPKKISVVTAPTRWQVDLELEPVGYETDGSPIDNELTGTDGTIKPIDELSYIPLEGWESFNDDDEFGADGDPLTKNERNLAKEGIWRLYRVKKDGVTLEGNKVELTDVKQILPLIGELLETIGEGVQKRPKEAFVWGNFYQGEPPEGSTATNDITREDFRPALKYKGSFSIDEENGLVSFAEPVFVYSEGVRGDVIRPKLWLRCSINLRDGETRAAQRQFKEITVDPSSPAQTLFIPREDIVPEWKKNTGDEWESNEEDIEAEADFYLQQELRNYQTLIGANAEYAGFIPLNVDGAIRQVSYKIDASGKSMTTVSRNTESFKLGLTFEEAKQRRKWSEAAAKAEREKRQQRRKPKDRNE